MKLFEHIDEDNNITYQTEDGMVVDQQTVNLLERLTIESDKRLKTLEELGQYIKEVIDNHHANK